MRCGEDVAVGKAVFVGVNVASCVEKTGVTVRLGVGVVVSKINGGVGLGLESVCAVVIPAVAEGWPVISGTERVPLPQERNANESVIPNDIITARYGKGIWRRPTCVSKCVFTDAKLFSVPARPAHPGSEQGP